MKTRLQLKSEASQDSRLDQAIENAKKISSDSETIEITAINEVLNFLLHEEWEKITGTEKQIEFAKKLYNEYFDRYIKNCKEYEDRGKTNRPAYQTMKNAIEVVSNTYEAAKIINALNDRL